MRTRRMALAAAALLLAGSQVITSGVADAAVSITRAELAGNRLRIEGRALAATPITVDGVTMTTSDAAGNFKIDRSPFAQPADCIVHVNDGSASDTPARLAGCAVATTPAPGATGTIAIVRGGNGHGRITSQPAGIDCTIAADAITGPCQAPFAAGTRVRLDARPAADSQFQGWVPHAGCTKPPDVTVAADVIHPCQPGFVLR